MKDKRFQHHYVTLKVEDIKHFLSRDEQEQLEDMCNKIAVYRKAAGKQDLEGIFIKSDWPEYKSAACALNNRITGGDLYAGHASLPDMIQGHLNVWATALGYQQSKAKNDSDRDYYYHELRALDLINVAANKELEG